MKLKYESPKGWRVKNRMIGVELYLPPDVENNLWWSYNKKQWIGLDNSDFDDTCSTTAPVKSFRAFRRHIKRKCNDLPKGTRIVLVCRFRHANIIHIKK